MVHYHCGDQHDVDHDGDDNAQHDGHHDEEERGVPLPIPRKPAAAQLLFPEKRLCRDLCSPVLHPFLYFEKTSPLGPIRVESLCVWKKRRIRFAR